MNDQRIRFFDSSAPFQVVERALPHWLQAGTVSFLTWRTWDSIPENVLNQWLTDRVDWLRRHGINPKRSDWQSELSRLPTDLVTTFRRTFSGIWEQYLDDCRGSCPFKQPMLAEIVGNSLHHFDGAKYFLTDFVVMPNHVHVLVAFPDDASMLAQCESWKRYTAVRLNRRLKRSGRFWEVDGFDHLVRDENHFDKFRQYIADNPRRAGLKVGEFLWFTKREVACEVG